MTVLFAVGIYAIGKDSQTEFALYLKVTEFPGLNPLIQYVKHSDCIAAKPVSVT